MQEDRGCVTWWSSGLRTERRKRFIYHAPDQQDPPSETRVGPAPSADDPALPSPSDQAHPGDAEREEGERVGDIAELQGAAS